MSNLTDDEREALGPFVWGGWIGVARGREAAFSHGLHATVERIVAARERAARAEAWDEGHRHPQRHGPDDCHCAARYQGECACGEFGAGDLVSLDDNPYRE